ncbi:hypothetical protein [Nocardioides sp. TF02-7]|uniref:hypothetical protein n=1 Tax=Nocardioides sp. TF02-7 TaxID=2917724 RepID=UPI001F060882|nr:hypothetical protein [Nocardioides sp. TF02-7]UMG92185.1 hypothetical protein MF408_20050 [Nocardioides sp. TF02-7]
MSGCCWNWTAYTATTARHSTPTISQTTATSLLAVASSAVEGLENYGVDPLSVELILAMLVDAQDLDIG